jgi:hypothetical protein
MKEQQKTLQDDIENILSSTPFHTVTDVKKDFLFRISEFYEYKYKELKGGDIQISKDDFSFKLDGKDLDQKIAETVTNKLKDDLELYRTYALNNSTGLSRQELNNNLYRILSTQGFTIKEDRGNYTFSKNDYTEFIGKEDFDNLVKKVSSAMEKRDHDKMRFNSKVDSALLLTRGSNAKEIEEIFFARMKNDHSYECRITETGNYYFIPDYNSFYENKNSYEISRKEIDLKIEKILNSRLNNNMKTNIEPKLKSENKINQIEI